MSRRYPNLHKLFIVLADFFTVIISYFVAIDLRNYILRKGFSSVDYFEFPNLIFYIIIVWWTLLLLFDSTESERFKSFGREIGIGIKSSLISLAFLLGIGFLTKYYYPRSIIISFCICFVCLWVLQKIIVNKVIVKIRKEKKISILIVGASERAINFCKKISSPKGVGYKIVGFLDVNEKKIGQKIADGQYIIGSFAKMKEILKTYLIHEVFFVLEPKHFGYFESLLSVCEELGIDSRFICSIKEFNPYKGRPDIIAGYQSILYSRLPQEEMSLFIKRLFDIILSALLLVLLSPIFLLISIIIKLTSKGPVFFPWKVVGVGNRDFVGYKFRTMVENAEELKGSLISKNEMNGPVFKIKDDPRITPFGKWLRKYSLDEFPQLWSVLKGDMSLVGPRPPNRKELARYEFWQRRKISFKPGMTCLWQINGRNRISDFNEWCKLDLEYIDNWSLWLDFKIFLKTALVVVKGTGY